MITAPTTLASGAGARVRSHDPAALTTCRSPNAIADDTGVVQTLVPGGPSHVGPSFFSGLVASSRALPAGRIAALGATMDLHHGLLALHLEAALDQTVVQNLRWPQPVRTVGRIGRQNDAPVHHIVDVEHALDI